MHPKKICTRKFMIVPNLEKNANVYKKTECINKFWYIHTVEYYSTRKKNEQLMHVQHRWASKILCNETEAIHKSEDTISATYIKF